MRYARLDKRAVVAEIIEADTPLAETFEPAFAARCLPCGPEVEQGWYCGGLDFSPPEPTAEDLALKARRAEIIAALAELDAQTIRPLRAQIAGLATRTDLDKLTELEAEAASLRAELAAGSAGPGAGETATSGD